MGSVFTSSIRGYEVMTAEGTELGTVQNVTMDPRTGELQHLRLTEHNGGGGGYERVEDGQLLIPADRVEAIQDYVLVSPPR